MHEEKHLFEAARRGSIAGFEAVLSRYEQKIYHYIWRMVRDPRDAQDLTQETFVKLYRSIRKIDPDKNPAAFIFTIATRTVYDFLRKSRHRKEDFIIDDPEAGFETIDPDDPYIMIERVESARELAGAMERLKPRYRAVLMLYYREDLGYQDIAQALQIPLNTVKTYLYRAKKELKEILAESNHHDG